ncbi:MAG: pyruvate formate lyase family protein, partial [Anaerolineae bacterium]
MEAFGATARIENLRAQLLAEETIPRDEPELLWGRAWMASGDEPWNIVRRARATAAVLEGITPEIGQHELLVGTFSRRNLSDAERVELQRWREEQAPASSPVWGQRAHMAIDYETLLRRGLGGLRAQIALYRRRLDLTRPDDLERDAFYRACEIALDGLGRLSQRYADEAERQAAMLAIDDPRASELYEIARVCRRVPEHPAETFREALQAIHLVTFALCAGQLVLLFQLGRPDRYLLPLYERDLAEGRLTRQDAQELIDCLCLMLSSYTPRGLAVGFMIGGRDASGRDVSNELTELFLESIAHTRMAYPGIGLCWNENTPDAIMGRACDLLADGLTHPALFGDDLITRGMLEAGLPPAEACLYQHSTCVELTPIASSNVYVASPYINLVQLLHDLLGVAPLGGQANPATAECFDSFAALMEAYEGRLTEEIRQAVIEQNTAQMTRYHHGGFPLLSCFVNDCLAKGRDIDQGGARYNWIEPSFVGLANLVDALVAIRQYVFDEGALDLEELRGALASDFAGREDLRLMLLQGAQKYGNDDDAVDALAVHLTSFIADEVRRYRTYLGGAYHPGFFCWIMHERLGRVTAASADGRHAGQALGDGSGPAQGRQRQGPTAAVLSATKWDHAPMLGGIAVNVRFTRSQQPGDFRQGLRSLVETYL